MTFLRKFRPALAMMLALVLVLGLCACGKSDPVETTAATTAPTEKPTEAPTEGPIEEPTEDPQPEPADGTEMVGLDRVRERMSPSGALGGIIFLGITDSDIYSQDFWESVALKGYLQEFPFLEAVYAEAIMNDTRYAHTDGFEVYCIIPQDPDSEVVMTKWDEETQTEGGMIYASQDGDPFLLQCNASDIMPNTLLYIENSTGSLNEYMPSLKAEDGHINLPPDPYLHLMDLTRYDDDPNRPHAFNLFLPDLDTGKVDLLYTTLDMLDVDVIVNLFIEQGKLPEEVYVTDFNTMEGEMDLELDESIVDYLNTLTEGEADLLLECLANSYIQAFGVESVTYYVNGAYLETENADYSGTFEFTAF